MSNSVIDEETWDPELLAEPPVLRPRNLWYQRTLFTQQCSGVYFYRRLVFGTKLKVPSFVGFKPWWLRLWSFIHSFMKASKTLKSPWPRAQDCLKDSFLSFIFLYFFIFFYFLIFQKYTESRLVLLRCDLVRSYQFWSNMSNITICSKLSKCFKRRLTSVAW